MRIPSTVRMVAEVIGMDAAVRLMQASYPNGQVYVPAGNISPQHRLATFLQPDELTRLQRHFAGELIPYATARGAKRAVRAERRRKRMVEMLDQGLTPRQIAQALGCSPDVARVMRNRLRKARGS